MVILLRAVCVAPASVVFKLRQQEKPVGGGRHIAGRVGSAAGVVAVLGHRLHNGSEIRRQGRQQGVCRRAGGRPGVAQDILPHVGTVPASGIGPAGVHVEVPGPARIASVLAITQAHQLVGDFPDLEVDPVAPLPAAVVVETQDKDGNGQVGKSEIPHFPVDGDGLCVAHIPIVVPLACVGNRLDGGPRIAVQGGADRGHGDGLGGGLGHASLAVRNGDRIVSRRQGASGGIGVPAHRRAAVVGVIGGHHHAGGAEILPGEIAGPAGRRGYGDMVQHLGHRDGLRVRFGYIALRVRDRNGGVAHAQGGVWGKGVPGYRPALPVGVVGGYHHSGGVEYFPIFVRRFCGRRGDLNAGQHPYSHWDAGGFLDPCPLIVHGDGRGVLGNAGGGECAIVGHIFGCIVRKCRRYHHSGGVKRFSDVIGGLCGLRGHRHPACDHQVHLIQQGAGYLHLLAGALSVQCCGYGPFPDVRQLKLRCPRPLQGGFPVRTGNGGTRAGGYLNTGALYAYGLFQTLEGGPHVLAAGVVIERDVILRGHGLRRRQGVGGRLVIGARCGRPYAVCVPALSGGLGPFQQALHLDGVLLVFQGAVVGLRVLVVIVDQIIQTCLQLRL